MKFIILYTVACFAIPLLFCIILWIIMSCCTFIKKMLGIECKSIGPVVKELEREQRLQEQQRKIDIEYAIQMRYLEEEAEYLAACQGCYSDMGKEII